MVCFLSSFCLALCTGYCGVLLRVHPNPTIVIRTGFWVLSPRLNRLVPPKARVDIMPSCVCIPRPTRTSYFLSVLFVPTEFVGLLSTPHSTFWATYTRGL